MYFPNRSEINFKSKNNQHYLRMSNLQRNNGFLLELVLRGKKRHLHFENPVLSSLNVKTTFDAHIIILNFSLGISQLSQNGCKA